MNNKKLGILVITALLSVSSSVMADDAVNYYDNTDTILEKVKPNKETVAKAREAIQNKDFQTAVDLLTAYINEKPRKYEVYKLRGDAYYALRRYDLAQKDYQSAIDLKTNDDKLMTNTKYVSAIVLGADKNEQLQNVELGDLYGALMYAQKAQNDHSYTTSYENAVKYNSHIYLPQPNKNEINKINCPQKYGKIINPQGIDASIYGAINDIEGGNYNEAIYKLQSVTNAYPNYYLGHYLTGVALSELEKDDDAIKSFERAIFLNPYDFESYASLGRIYYSKAETTFTDADSKKSTDYFNRAIQLNKNCPTYYFYIGMNELQSGNTNVAIYNFDKALQINPSDYNSMYYKFIALYMNGKYQDVVDGATKLLYRHVSNYNSVLYLRALAYTKLNDTEKALQDLDSAENNIEDIYNVDIKKISSREKSLESYIHYLKSEIQHSKGIGAASDNSLAYSNPIINRLANAKKAIAPYEKSLEGETISLSDYNKFESFYSTSLPKLLESGAVITYEDIDNQYDYIRTTFSDIGVSFIYLNPDYKITTIKDYPYKKYSSKLKKNEADTLSIRSASETENVQLARNEHDALRKSTPKSELLVQSGQVSLAQLLASNDLSMKSKYEKPVSADNLKSINTPAKTENVQFKSETPAAENINTSKNIASGETYTGKTSLVSSENNANVRNILVSEEKIANNVPELRINNTNVNKAQESLSSPVAKADSLKITADEVKQTEDVVIKYKEVSQPSEVAVALTNQGAKTVEAASENVNEMIANAEEETKEQLKIQKELDKQLKVAQKEQQKAEKQVQKELKKQLVAQEKAVKQAQKAALKTENDAKKIVKSQTDTVLKEAETENNIIAMETPVKITEKHANPDAVNNLRKPSELIISEGTTDVVILDTGSKETVIVSESDLFTKDTKFTKPQSEMPSIKPIDIEKPQEVQEKESIKQEQIQIANSKTATPAAEVKKTEEPQQAALNSTPENKSVVAKQQEKSEEPIKSVENNKIYAEKQLSDFLNASMPEKFFEDKGQDEYGTESTEIQIKNSENENTSVTNPPKKEKTKSKVSKDKKAQKKFSKVKSQVPENEDEAKLQQLKSKLENGNVLSDEEKKAQKAQLKAERAAARAAYKAQKAAKKASE